MSQSTEPPHNPAPVPSAIYWRRRVLALAIGILLVSLLAWAVNGTFGGHAAAGKTGSSATTTSSARAGSSPTHRQGNGQAGASPSAGPGRGSAGGGAPSRPRGSASAQAGPQPSGTASRQPAPFSGAPACPPGTVVLSLFSARSSYPAGQQVQFMVAVVSTGSRPCGFNAGARGVWVVITEGRTRIWSSADCVRGAGTHTVTLTKGVPVMLHTGWGRQASAPGCRHPAMKVPPGSYTATAVSGQLRSRSLGLVLRSGAVAVR